MNARTWRRHEVLEAIEQNNGNAEVQDLKRTLSNKTPESKAQTQHGSTRPCTPQKQDVPTASVSVTYLSKQAVD